MRSGKFYPEASMKKSHSTIAGHLVTLTTRCRSRRNLDGFWVTGKQRSQKLLIFVHGMGSNFYKSRFKKAWMKLAPARGLDVFCFNNRGCESDVTIEHFPDCLHDLDAALEFALSEGYRDVFLLGHSTGCQKITFYFHKRKPRSVRALLLTALGDDLAIARRDLGRSYPGWIQRAQQLVAQGKGDHKLPAKCMGFSAKRFLSAAGPKSIEANLFRLDGKMKIFSSLTLPVLAVFPEQEQYACIPVHNAGRRLKAVSRSRKFEAVYIPEADHSFRGREDACVRACLGWLDTLVK